MDKIKVGFFLILIASVGIAFSACRSSVRYTHTATPKYKAKHTGPPPHAPAHGYRHKHPDGVELVYQSSIGVYIVTGYSHHYFCKDRYYRLNKGYWQYSVHIKGPWKPVSEKKLPPGLRKQKFKVTKKKTK
ncbi:MAG: hypothetical protein GTO29_08365 [Candidatus Latescibacteria bacterium]|nr:hypothetical protein [Candidatus Latescibacterota bacterium]NIO56176.1 hypothetical protein [Candidatus Latescibacterota bacterium]